MDLVFPTCAHSMCVTKSYGRFHNGTGSVLVMESPDPTSSNGYLSSENMLKWSGRLRFFSPLETYHLMGFKLSSRDPASIGSREAATVEDVAHNDVEDKNTKF